MVFGDAFFCCFFIIVFALNKFTAADIAYAGHFWRAVVDVVIAFALATESATKDAMDDDLVWDFEDDDGVDVEMIDEELSLMRIAWEAIKDVTLSAVGLVESVQDNVLDDGVWDEIAFVDEIADGLSVG